MFLYLNYKMEKRKINKDKVIIDLEIPDENTGKK
jgi:hypothetical protein